MFIVAVLVEGLKSLREYLMYVAIKKIDTNGTESKKSPMANVW